MQTYLTIKCFGITQTRTTEIQAHQNRTRGCIVRCPKCKSKAVASATRFIEYSNSQRRIRTCKCGFKFTTYERIESETQDLSKHSKQKKKQYYRKILLQLIDDLDGRTYLDTPKPKV